MLKHTLVPELFSEKKRFEGLRLIAYIDKGKMPDGSPNYAIGWGHSNKSGRPPKVYPGMVCTVAQAHEWYVADTMAFAETIEPMIKVPTDNYMFSGLVFFAFNIGPTAFGKSTVLKLINKGPKYFQQAMRRMTDWDNSEGKELDGLFIRRCAEITLCMRGIIK